MYYATIIWGDSWDTSHKQDFNMDNCHTLITKPFKGAVCAARRARKMSHRMGLCVSRIVHEYKEEGI